MNANDEAREFLGEVADEMVRRFGISMDEAQGRIERFFAGRDLTLPMAVSVLLHEEADAWARTIYYGREADWWLGEDGLEPTPYP